ncbi:MAG: energy transducer TonB [Bacteroidales bacterium]|jgi:protein TonB|nr:energy transducer TonB [Bacteroidales bacterium]
MELKKSDKANLEKKRTMFIEIGMLVALGFVLLAFEWQTSPRVISDDFKPVQAAIEEEIIPITRQDQPPPPAPEPPKVADILSIVDDNVQVESDFQIDVEADQNLEIDIVEYEEAELEEEEEEFLFAVIEDKPLFNGKPADEGFREYVSKNTVYPPVAQENGLGGRVYIEFVIDKDGSVIDAKVVRGQDPSLDAEALRVVKSSPKWTPGKQRGKAVKVRYTFPVNFRLQN